MLILRPPYLGRDSLSPAMGDGDGHTVSGFFQAFVLWRLSLVVCCASSESQSSVAESQPLSQNRRIAVHSPSSSSDLFNSVSVGAAKPYSVPGHAPHSRCPSPHFLGRHASVFCVSNTASCQSPPYALRSSVSVWFPCTLELWFLVWVRAFPSSWSHSTLSRVPVCESGHSPV